MRLSTSSAQSTHENSNFIKFAFIWNETETFCLLSWCGIIALWSYEVRKGFYCVQVSCSTSSTVRVKPYNRFLGLSWVPWQSFTHLSTAERSTISHRWSVLSCSIGIDHRTCRLDPHGDHRDQVLFYFHERIVWRLMAGFLLSAQSLSCQKQPALAYEEQELRSKVAEKLNDRDKKKKTKACFFLSLL